MRCTRVEQISKSLYFVAFFLWTKCYHTFQTNKCWQFEKHQSFEFISFDDNIEFIFFNRFHVDRCIIWWVLVKKKKTSVHVSDHQIRKEIDFVDWLVGKPRLPNAGIYWKEKQISKWFVHNISDWMQTWEKLLYVDQLKLLKIHNEFDFRWVNRIYLKVFCSDSL